MIGWVKTKDETVFARYGHDNVKSYVKPEMVNTVTK